MPSQNTPAAPPPGRPGPFDALADRDPVLRELMNRFGRPDPFHWGWAADREGADAFRTLLLQIVSQRVPATVAFALFDRLETATGEISPAAVRALGVDGLRASGLTEAKALAAMDLADTLHDGRLDLERLPLDDEATITALTSVRGIGRWSAQMFLIGHLHRPDVLPSGDYGIRRAIQTAWRLDAEPTVKAVDRQGLTWAPYRTYATVLLWTSRLKAPHTGGASANRLRGKFAAAGSSGAEA